MLGLVDLEDRGSRLLQYFGNYLPVVTSCAHYAGNKALLNKMTNLNNKFLGEASNGIARCRRLNFLTDKSQIKETKLNNLISSLTN
jgi:hypothetical protein